MSLPSVTLRVKKQEKYLAKSLANNTHFDVDEIEGLFNMYRQEIQQYFEVVLDLCFLWTTLSHIVDINNVVGCMLQTTRCADLTSDVSSWNVLE